MRITRLSYARAQVRQWLTEDVTILARTRVDDSAGGYTWTEASPVVVKGRLEARTTEPREETVGGRIAARSAWTCYLPHDASVKPPDVLVIGGARYEVIDHDAGRSDPVVIAVTLHKLT